MSSVHDGHAYQVISAAVLPTAEPFGVPIFKQLLPAPLAPEGLLSLTGTNGWITDKPLGTLGQLFP